MIASFQTNSTRPADVIVMFDPLHTFRTIHATGAPRRQANHGHEQENPQTDHYPKPGYASAAVFRSR